MTTAFSHLEDLIKTYFHQDYDLIADDLESLMQHYVTTTPQVDRNIVRAEIDRYLTLHERDLDQAFRRDYEYDVDPKTWSYSTKAFLRKLSRLVE